ncbi:MAG: hypothetical protein RLZZ173_1211, partial [Pseudomonadota bacterium]
KPRLAKQNKKPDGKVNNILGGHVGNDPTNS